MSFTIHAAPGVLSINDRDWPVIPPTPADKDRIYKTLFARAAAKCVNPVTAVTSIPQELLKGEDRRAAIAEAVASLQPGGVTPSGRAVADEYDCLGGVRFQLWYYLVKSDPSVTRELIDSLVTESTMYAVTDHLLIALGLKDVDPKKASPTGA